MTSAALAQVNCAATGTTGVPQIECEALMALYNATDGPNWHDNNNWNTPSDIDTWHGIVVFGGSVVDLALGNNRLLGSLPRELGDLSDLSSLALDNNQLTGPIPPELGNLSDLGILWLNNNQLTGTIPPELAQANLFSLILEGNQLTGSIPSEFANFTRVAHIRVGHNQLSGRIPDLSALPLTQFRFEDNAFVFADFEPEFNAYNDGVPAIFEYAPQAMVDIARTEFFDEGGAATLVSAVAVNPSGNDQYQWYKNDAPIAAPFGTQRNLDLTLGTGAVTAAEEGEYFYTIANNVVTGLVLTSEPITVNVVPVTCGNGTLDPNEACDDGNVLDGDGCSAACLLEDDEPCTDSEQCMSNFCDASQAPAVCGPATTPPTSSLPIGRWHGGGCSVGAVPYSASRVWLLVIAAGAIARRRWR